MFARFALWLGAVLLAGTLGALGCSSDDDAAIVGTDASVEGSADASADRDASPSKPPEDPTATQICPCPGSCGHPAKDVTWPASRSCANGACDGISNDVCDGG